MELAGILRGEYVVGHASKLAHELFKDIVRDTGLPYTQEHLAKVAFKLQEITMPSRYRDAAVGAAWLHDAVEDTYVQVINPFDASQEKGIGTYLNDLFAEAGEEGKALCFIVHLMTHRKGTSYPDYVGKIFTFPDDGRLRQLHILAALVKMADRRMNINPDESRNVNALVEEYVGLKDLSERALEEFYKRTKTIDAFRRKGSLEIDVGLFVKTLLNEFEAKQRTTALDNLSLYVPQAEQKLLIEVGENNGLFRWRAVREMLKEIYTASLRLYPGDVHDIRRLGVNRDASYPEGYTPILKEVRLELAMPGQ